jgi:hypothetical protein
MVWLSTIVRSTLFLGWREYIITSRLWNYVIIDLFHSTLFFRPTYSELECFLSVWYSILLVIFVLTIFFFELGRFSIPIHFERKYMLGTRSFEPGGQAHDQMSDSIFSAASLVVDTRACLVDLLAWASLALSSRVGQFGSPALARVILLCTGIEVTLLNNQTG